MKTVTLVIEMEVGDFMYDETDGEEVEWFQDKVLNPKNGLFLHSNEIGDEVGEVKNVIVLSSWITS